MRTWFEIGLGERFDTVRWKSAAIAMLTVLISSISFPLSAEVNNRTNIFESVDVCESYSNFLEMAAFDDTSNCHTIAKYLLANSDLGNQAFLRKLYDTTGENSSLGAIAQTMFATMRQDVLLAVSTSEMANRRILVSLTSSGDVERAVVYSHLLSEIQKSAIQNLCGSKDECDEIASVGSLESILGPQFSELDAKRADIVLMCLLRTDAYLTPIRFLLSSERFDTCLQF